MFCICRLQRNIQHLGTFIWLQSEMDLATIQDIHLQASSKRLLQAIWRPIEKQTYWEDKKTKEDVPWLQVNIWGIWSQMICTWMLSKRRHQSSSGIEILGNALEFMLPTFLMYIGNGVGGLALQNPVLFSNHLQFKQHFVLGSSSSCYIILCIQYYMLILKARIY